MDYILAILSFIEIWDLEIWDLDLFCILVPFGTKSRIRDLIGPPAFLKYPIKDSNLNGSSTARAN